MRRFIASRHSVIPKLENSCLSKTSVTFIEPQGAHMVSMVFRFHDERRQQNRPTRAALRDHRSRGSEGCAGAGRGGALQGAGGGTREARRGEPGGTGTLRDGDRDTRGPLCHGRGRPRDRGGDGHHDADHVTLRASV